MLPWPDRIRRKFYELRIEGEGRGREAAALGLGLFIGCTPFYGFHLLLCWFAGWALRLNRLKLYLAANISNPIFSPFLILTELQTGAWVRRHDLHDLTIAAIRQTDPWTFGADLLIGSAIVGALLGLSVAAATLTTGGLREEDPQFDAVWRRASDPYLRAGVTAWEFARGKLRGDPVYRQLLAPGVIAADGLVIDLGCGAGLALSVLNAAGRLAPPARAIGIELRSRAARVARETLGDAAEIREGDARTAPLPPCRTVLLLDVLHMISERDQEDLLERIAAAVEPGGTVVVREADASGGLGFACVRAGNRLKAIVTGNWRQRFAFRSRQGWAALLERHGLQVSVRPAAEGTPFANLLVVGRRPAGRAALHEASEVHHRGNRAVARVVFPAEPEGADGF